MSDPSRKETTIRYGDETLTIRFNNMGTIAAERFMQGGSEKLRQQVASFQPSDEAIAALLYGGTRKHHARDYQDEFAIYELKDEIEEYYEDADDPDGVIEHYMAPLLAPYLGTTVRNIVALMNGEEPPDQMGNRAERRKKKKGKTAGPTKVEKAEDEEAKAS